MNELILEITEISPSELFGQQNANINLLKSYYPKLKIVARGNRLTVFGDEDLLEEFDKKFTQLMEHFVKYNKLDENAIERILTSNSKEEYETTESSGATLVHGVGGKQIKAQTANQRKLVELMVKNDMVFAVGPAGTGKTYTGVALAVKALKEKQVKKIILTRPAVEAGENLGFLPGDMKEKLDPYMQPLYDALRDMIPHETLASYLEKGIVQIAPLAFMRGRTLDNAFVILDEAQNTTHAQMKMFLTRMGKNAKFMITGDPGQIDLPRRVISGLKEALLVLKEVKGIGVVYLDDKDVIRHRLVKEVIAAYKSIENLE
ncbi:MAG: phosphate starvation-inducible protein PhoH [Flavobacteriaceae bacterium CG_4_8_14_3_um_filter_34_10]|nr:PhoH family protein [Flavobacteriia bacterium]OIP49643.1 MAG: phosphate starvation-inducible protein PhoH [Flavobacteriaceae bacterium CG2_30_34_30]PIQ19164.1 MAG: phosphate starvation-inducible protein PhoH [Flavobacteriaceae bacterium CG18_big_fil_WC_8_21_14_2_50_34_36]PIV48379.1 MAG: phosphate starvation-inducible protein PhoH [Flavobacteriaceae bacterium CG02_land_8_20_14_3_00_34_13]PIX08599.1 MAG: phosphate starvation-inducible protein PhoH [Flavobacteriaceae bacterium CG_4_8_14_3_um_fi